MAENLNKNLNKNPNKDVNKHVNKHVNKPSTQLDTMELAIVNAIKKNIFNLAAQWVNNISADQAKAIYTQLGEGNIDFGKPEVLSLMKKFDAQMKPNYYGRKSFIYYIPFAIREAIKNKYARELKLTNSFVNSRLLYKYAKIPERPYLIKNSKVLLPNNRGIGILEDDPELLESFTGFDWIARVKAENPVHSGIYYVSTLSGLKE